MTQNNILKIIFELGDFEYLMSDDLDSTFLIDNLNG